MLRQGDGSVSFLQPETGLARHLSLTIWPSRPEAAILVILENTSGTGWLLLTIAHARNDVPLR